ncbi:serpin (serine protease inhibitor) domain-containing protein [Phthorimaea operculella]|nr:serpin (serine protease inhibitor) domain-containing protein [Phthorimaea operculella]
MLSTSARLMVLFALCVSIHGNLENVNQGAAGEAKKCLHNGLTERVGNFSIELLYHTSKFHQKGSNLIMSPFTVWTALAVISEGATGLTARQINHALRITAKHRNATRNSFQSISKWLQVKTDTVEMTKVNAIYMDQQRLLQKDFQETVENIYKMQVVPLDFTDTVKTAQVINEAVSNATHGRISRLVEGSQFGDSPMILTSALFFKGEWKSPFNATETKVMPFYDSVGNIIGNVNMMYNRYTYAYANIRKLQARVIEIPYGNEDRMSMLIMVPHSNVSLENMFFNFAKVPLDELFEELKISKEEYEDSEVDCYIPRFKIESSLDLSNV